MNPGTAITDFLGQLRRRARGTLLLWAVLAALTGLMLDEAHRLGWIAWGPKTVLVALALSVFLLGWWCKRARRLGPTTAARELDSRWNLQSHLESASDLAAENSVWAEAQRRDTARRLAGREPPGSRLWFTGLLLGTVVLCLLGIEGTTAAWREWARPAASVPAPPPSPPSATEPPAAKAPPAKPEIHASIVWKSPEDQIKATAIEEVPLVAYAESDSGFRSVSLHYTVNGGAEVSLPLDAPALGLSAQPGGHELKPSLYLDELKVKEFDVVAYHLVGELNTPSPSSVASPLQFIQIRKTQADMDLASGGNGPLVGMIRGLEVSQIELIKSYFALVHAPGPVDPGRVASDQLALAGTADDTRKFAATQDVPEELLGDLDKAETAMKEAAGKIGQGETAAGATAQNRALAALVACEKFFGMAAGGQAISSPFKDDQSFTLPPRPATPAGNLEQLAQRQQKANQATGGAGPPDQGAAGGAAQTQAAIARDAQALDRAGGLDQPVASLLHTAAAAAAEAAKQLGLNDASAARVPAAEAERKLAEAVAAQEKSGRARAAALLDATRRGINEAARTGNDSTRRSQLGAIQQSLRAAATQEQQTGSAEAAQLLAALAAQADAPAARTDPHPSEPYSQARAREMAAAAARSQVVLLSPGVALDRAIRQLNLIGKAATPSAPGSVPPASGDLLSQMELSSQEAEWIADDAATVGLARQASSLADSLQQGRPTGAELKAAAESAAALAAALQRGHPNQPADEIVRRFQPDDVDPLYRPAVESYFEHLSREGGAVAPAAPK